MSERRNLWAVVALAATLHLAGMARSPLPAQDGLKFIRVAREFQTGPWVDAVRGSDAHPLYPALIALAEPVVRPFTGAGPDAWRIAAQVVSVLAALAALFPLHALARSLFDERTADVATFFASVVPICSELGHDTLADSVTLLGVLWSVCLAERGLRTGSIRCLILSGLAAGLAYLARPEAIIVPLAIAFAAAITIAARAWRGRDEGAPRPAFLMPLAGLAFAFFAVIGSYAAVKGEVSEKLAIRGALGLAPSYLTSKNAAPPLPAGLDDARWDFSPKEESGDDAYVGRPLAAASQIMGHWADEMGYALLALGLLGLVFARSGPGWVLVASTLVLFLAALTRHATVLGYVSGRHLLIPVALALPWTGAGYAWFTRSCAIKLGLNTENTPGRRRVMMVMGVALAVAVAALRPGHANRWGHQAAGHWLAGNAGSASAVLDTRGWAGFVSGREAYDYWHVRQALADPKLDYLVVGADELAADSPRAETLRAMVAHGAEPAASFPSRRGGTSAGVHVYKFRKPASWETLRR
ncbi:glycosyltransferase family 39 protein [Isosphaeraceae bacterium EP7]